MPSPGHNSIYTIFQAEIIHDEITDRKVSRRFKSGNNNIATLGSIAREAGFIVLLILFIDISLMDSLLD